MIRQHGKSILKILLLRYSSMEIEINSKDVSVPLYARASNGDPLVGKKAADFQLWYRRSGKDIVEVPLVDLDSVDAPHRDGGVIEIKDSEYRFDLPDEAVEEGVPSISVGGSVDGGVVLGYPIPLVNYVYNIDTTGIEATIRDTIQHIEIKNEKILLGACHQNVVGPTLLPKKKTVARFIRPQ